MRALIILAALLLSPWALAEVPDYVGRSLNKTVVVDGPRRYTVRVGNGTIFVHKRETKKTPQKRELKDAKKNR